MEVYANVWNSQEGLSFINGRRYCMISWKSTLCLIWTLGQWIKGRKRLCRRFWGCWN